MTRIAEMDNLREAFLSAACGKRSKREVVAFSERLDGELELMRRQLLDGSYRFGDYRYFKLYDPKCRQICVAPFRDRVAAHAMMRVCHGVFERYQTSVSFASRIGLGTYKAVEKAQSYSRRYKWFLKMDMCKFFDSIEHGCLKTMLASLFKDRLLLSYFEMLIDGYEVTPQRGLPIGNLTSQYFANHYLAVADHYAKEQLHAKGMVRYMDDVVIWSDTREELLEESRNYGRFIEQELKLQMHPLCMNRTTMGMSFLGYVVYPHQLRLNKRSRRRYKDKEKKLCKLLEQGDMTERQCLDSLQSMLAFVEKAESRHYLHSLRR